jgi:hypothetical protein
MASLALHIARACTRSAPGISRIWLADHALLGAVRHTGNDLSIITGLNALDTDDPIVWQEWGADRAVFVEDWLQAQDLQAQRLNMSYPKPTPGKRDAVEQLKGLRLLAVIEDRNGQRWLLGQEFGLVLEAPRRSTGDASQTAFSLVGTERHPARFITSAAMNDGTHSTIISGTPADSCECDTLSYYISSRLASWPADLTPILDIPIISMI